MDVGSVFLAEDDLADPDFLDDEEILLLIDTGRDRAHFKGTLGFIKCIKGSYWVSNKIIEQKSQSWIISCPLLLGNFTVGQENPVGTMIISQLLSYRNFLV